jgi:hypothetical protein
VLWRTASRSVRRGDPQDRRKDANGGPLVMQDAEGEHNPAQTSALLGSTLVGEADPVPGRSVRVARPSAWLLGRLAGRRGARVTFSWTGFRAVRTAGAQALWLRGCCTRGTLLPETIARGAWIRQVLIELRTSLVLKRRSIAWWRCGQLHFVLSLLHSLRSRPASGSAVWGCSPPK